MPVLTLALVASLLALPAPGAAAQHETPASETTESTPAPPEIAEAPEVPKAPEIPELKYHSLGSRLSRIAVTAESSQASTETLIAVTVYVNGDVGAVVGFLEGNGGDPRNVGEDYIEAYVPTSLLGRLSQRPGVIRVREIVPPVTYQLPQSVAGRGPSSHGALPWHWEGYTGRGVKIGIVDSGFEGYGELTGTDLPAAVRFRCWTTIGYHSSDGKDCETKSDHGTLTAEMVFDVAPEASFYISNPDSKGDLRNTVDWMVAQGVDVIVHSVGWPWDGPGDGTSPFSDSPLRSIDRAVAGGIVFVPAVGNTNPHSWIGTAPVTKRTDLVLSGNVATPVDLVVFGGAPGAEDVGNELYVSPDKMQVQLRWEDSWTGAKTDLDLLIVDRTTNQKFVTSSAFDRQTGKPGDVPYESIVVSLFPGRRYEASILHHSGPMPDWIQLLYWDGNYQIEHLSDGYNIGSPAESANPGLLSVGAAHWRDTHTIEPYSGRGPTIDGRIKPEIVGVTCGPAARPGINAYCGSSAAAPHVAGLAALVRQRYPAWTPTQVTAYLMDNARQRATPDPNNTWGHGFAHLPAPAKYKGCEGLPNTGLTSDCQTLLAAATALKGSGRLNWSSTTPFTEWDGVTISGTTPRVTKLELGNRKLTGTIPASLGSLARLDTLSLEGNELTGAIPASLGGLAALTALRLNDNSLTGSIPSSLGGLAGLVELRLDGNGLTGSIPTELGGLAALTALRLDDNSLTGSIPSSLGGLAELGELRLSSNELSGAIPASLGSLGRLRRLHLDGNGLSGLVPPELANLTRLAELRLLGNALTGEVTLSVSPGHDIAEGAGAQTIDVTATLDPGTAWANNFEAEDPFAPSRSTVTVAVVGSGAGRDVVDFAPVGSFDISIPKDRASATGRFTLTPVGDSVDEDDEIITVSATGTGAENLADAVLSSATPAPTLTLTDDAGVSLAPDELAVDEGATATYSVRLNRAPGGPVTVTPSTSDTGAATFSPLSLSFTAANWNTAQTVTVTAVHDSDTADETATVSHSVSGSGYQGVTAGSVSIRVADDDRGPQVTLSLTNPSLSGETGHTDVQASVDSPLGRALAVEVSVPDGCGCTLSSNTTLIIPARQTNSRTGRGNRVRITAVDNDIDAPDRLVAVSGAVAADGVDDPAPVIWTITDDDTRGVAVTPTLIAMAGGDTATYTVKLDTEPTHTVTVTAAASADTDVSLTPSSLTFSPANWDTAQTVTVTAASDTDDRDDQAVISHGVTGGDYHRLAAPAVHLTVLEDTPCLNSAAAPAGSPPGVIADCTALLAAKERWTLSADALDSVNWSKDVSQWRSLTRESRKAPNGADVLRVTQLRLRGVELNGVVPAELGRLSELGELIMSDAKLTGTIPPELSSLADLETLDLSGNTLTGGVALSLSTTGPVPEDGGAQTVTVTATLDRGTAWANRFEKTGATTSGTTITVSVAGSGSSSDVVDFAPVADFTIVIPAGHASGTGAFTLTPVGDSVDEADETITVSAAGTAARGVVDAALAQTQPKPTITLSDDPTEAAPVFTSPAAFDAAEGQTAVGTVAASDADSQDSITGYAITGGADAAKFAIGETSGVLAFVSAPDFENPQDALSLDPLNRARDNQYVVEVTASSGTGNREMTAAQHITVTVTDVDEPPGKPAAPTETGATRNSLTVAWTAPSNPGPAISGYDVQYRKGDTGNWSQHAHDSTDTTATIDGLDADSAYQVQVRAENDEGAGEWSDALDASTSPNSPPRFTPATAERTVAENAPARTRVGAQLPAATDADGDELVYALGGDDAGLFEFNTQLRLVEVKRGMTLDYEADAEHRVTMTASDGQGGSATLEVTITVTNVEEAGTVTFDSAAPATGTVLTATLADPDGGISGLTWQWQASTDKTAWSAAAGSAAGSGLTSAYTPATGDVGKWLRATASYTDGHGPAKTSSAVTAAQSAAAQSAVTLVLSSASISENGGSTTVTATLSEAASSDLTIDVSAAPVSPATAADFTLSANTTLAIAAGETASTGTVTITAVDNGTSAAAKTVTVSGTVTGTGADDPADVTLTITDDDTSCSGTTATPSATASAGLVADCEILLAAKDALAGAATLNWATGTAIASWDGVTVGTVSGRVDAVDLSGESLSGVIPAVLGELSGLKTLDLSGNQLTGGLPPKLSGLSSLTALALHDNKLGGAIPPELAGLTGVTTLSLRGNAFTGKVTLALVQNFNALTELREGGGEQQVSITATLDVGTAWAASKSSQNPASKITLKFVGRGGATAADFTTDEPTISVDLGPGDRSTTYVVHITPVDDREIESGERLILTAVADGQGAIEDTPTSEKVKAVTLTLANEPSLALVDDDVANAAPAYAIDATTRSVPAGSATGTKVSVPVAAADADDAELAYTLSGTGHGDFAIDASGQITVASGLTRQRYNLTVSASDGLDANGAPSTAVDDSISVVVNVTPAPTAQPVPPNWSLIPTGVKAGDSFRLMFMSSTKRTAQSPDVNSYHRWVQNLAASNNALVTFSGEFRALVSVTDADAMHNTGTTHSSAAAGVPVYWLGGAKVADDYGDLYDGQWASRVAKTETGADGGFGHLIWTGTNPDGTRADTWWPGQQKSAMGSLDAAGSELFAAGEPPGRNHGVTEERQFYALSPVITVSAQADTTSPTITAGPAMVSSPRPDVGDAYWFGERITVGITFSEGVAVTGRPWIPITVGDSTRRAVYSSSTGRQVRFSYAVAAGDLDTDGISVPAGLITLPAGAAIRDIGGNDAVLTYTTELADQSGHKANGGPAPRNVPADWAFVPQDSSSNPVFTAGQSFRLIFVTSKGVDDAEANDIAHYNAAVQRFAATQSGLVDVAGDSLSGSFRALMSTADAHARDNGAVTGTGVPIYWLRGGKVADNYADFFDGTWSAVPGVNESGGRYDTFVWTGSNRDGSRDDACRAGIGAVRVGWPGANQDPFRYPFCNPRTAPHQTHIRNQYGYYALSPVLNVVNAPTFADGAAATRRVEENSAAGTAVGTPVAATDVEDATLAYTLGGDDAASFTIDAATGQISVGAGLELDFETESSYTVEVTATDSDGHNPTITVTIEVVNVDEPGTVSLDASQPRPGSALGAELADPDGDISGLTWTWETSAVAGTWAAGAGTATADGLASAYTPATADVGKQLRATASYTDGHGAAKTARAVAANAVALIPDPVVTLALSPASIADSGQKATVTARLDSAALDDVTVVVSATPLASATASHYTLSAGTVLTIAEGQTASSGTVAITAVADAVTNPTRWVRVSGRVSAGSAVAPASKLLAITDDDEEANRTCRDSNAVGRDPTPGLLADCAALLAARDDLIGDYPEARFELNWSKATSIHQWHGVTVANSRVTRLELKPQKSDDPRSPNLLFGEIPASLGRLSALTHLDVSGHDLIGGIPASLGNLSALTVLNLSGNEGIEDDIPASLGRLSALTVLNLADSSLEGEIPASLGDLSALTVLNLANSFLEGEIPAELARLSPTTLNLLGNEGANHPYYGLTAPVSLSLSRSAVSEGAGATTIEVTATLGPAAAWVNRRGGSAGAEAVVEFDDIGGTGTVGYKTVPAGVLKIPIAAGSTSGTARFTVTPVDDASVQTDAMVKVVLVDAQRQPRGQDNWSVLGNRNDKLTAYLTAADGPAFTITDDDGANTTPTFDDGSAAVRTVAENAAAGAAVGAALAVTDPDTADTHTFALTGSDAFTIDSAGQIKVAPAADLDWEGGPRSYRLTVTVSDGKASDGTADAAVDATIAVTVRVANADEPGAVSLDPADPLVGAPVTARLADPDGSISGVTWAWARADRADAAFAPIAGAAAASYTPVADDAGKWLRATATYTDGHGAAKTAQAVGTAAVDSAAAVVALSLGAALIDESGPANATTVTATLSKAVGTDVRVTISAEPTGVVALGDPATLVVAAGATTSTGSVTVTAINDALAAPDQQVALTGSVSGASKVAAPAPVRLAVVNDDAVAGQRAARFSGATQLTREIDEHAEPGAPAGAPVPAATDADGDTLVYAMGGADAALFVFDATTRQISLAPDASLDYESPADANSDNDYEVFVTVSDGKDAAGYAQRTPSPDHRVEVTISVVNVDEPGGVELDSDDPLAGTGITATVSDPDGGITALTWAWETSSDRTSWAAGAGTASSDTLSSTYTPAAADAGKWLRATAAYTDEQGSGKTAAASTANAVLVRGVTLSPGRLEVHEGGSASYTVVLTTAPSGAVTVTPSSSDAAKATVSGALTFTAADWDMPQTVTVTGVEDDDRDDESVTVSHAVSGADYGSVVAGDVAVTVIDDERIRALLTLSPAVIGESGGVATVTAVLSGAVAGDTTVTVSAAAVSPAVSGDFTLSENKMLTIAAGETVSTGTVTITAVGNTTLAANKTVTVSATVDNAAVGAPSDVTLTIAEDDYSCTGTTAVGSNPSAGLVADCEALLAARDVLAGSPGELNWSTGTAMADWDGVSLTGGRVSALRLRSEGLAGIVPPELGALSALKGLQLDGNDLSGSIPSELGGLSALEGLDLSGNDLSGSIPSELGGLSALEGLDLSGNDLSGAIPSELGGLSALVVLNLSGNDLSGAIPSELATGLTKLTFLYLAGNALSGEVALSVSPAGPVSEDAGAVTVTVTATLDEGTAWANRFIHPGNDVQSELDDMEAASTVTVTVSIAGEAGSVVVAPVTPFEIAIPNAESSASGTFTLTPTDDSVGNPDTTVSFSVSGTGATTVADAALSLAAAPAAPTITVVDDETVAVSLVLTPAFISEDGGVSAVSAMLAEAVAADVVVTVSASAVSPAVAGDFTLSANKELTIAAGETASTGTVTITAVDNSVSAANKAVTVSGAASSTGVRLASTVTLTVVEDDYSCTGTTAVGSTASLVTDCEALLAARDVLEGSSGELNWSTGTAMADWDGVTITSGRITSVDLPGESLDGAIATQLASVSALTNMDLSGNALSGPIPAELANLSALGYLDLSGNALSGSIPAALGGLSALYLLDLSGNALSGSIPAALGGLPALDLLWLHDNALSGAIPAKLADLPALTELRLEGNDLSGEVTLSVSPTRVSEDGGAVTVTVTATLDAGTAWANKFTHPGPDGDLTETADNIDAVSTLTVSAAGSGEADAVDFAAVSPFSITIPHDAPPRGHVHADTHRATSDAEVDETITVTATGTGAETVAGVVLSTASPAPTVTLADDDAPRVSAGAVAWVHQRGRGSVGGDGGARRRSVPMWW